MKLYKEQPHMSKFDDKDLDMEDIQGDVKPNDEEKQPPTEVKLVAEAPPVDEELKHVIPEPPPPPEEEKLSPEEQDFQAVVARLEKFADKTWICVPEVSPDGLVTTTSADMATCSNEFFYKWLCYIWPPAQTMDHRPEHYNEMRSRVAAFTTIWNFHKMCRFPETNPTTKKKKDKSPQKQ